MRHWHIGIEFKPQDLWIGVFWETESYGFSSIQTDIWICLLPMFPIHIIQIRPRNAGGR